MEGFSTEEKVAIEQIACSVRVLVLFIKNCLYKFVRRIRI